MNGDSKRGEEDWSGLGLEDVMALPVSHAVPSAAESGGRPDRGEDRQGFAR